jgi:1-deoxyxylulose-5-phosphate synthase
MSFGAANTGRAWTLDDDGAKPIFRQAVELGITFWDTANVYGHGTSEEIVGRAIKKYAGRDEIVLATKVYWPMHGGPGGSGLSRKAILEQVDGSLQRLGTDYVDLLQIHRFDPDTLVEETMEALHDVVKAGKARYIGASSMWAWRFAKMQQVAHTHGWTRFVSMQDQYSLLQREEEREMFGLLTDQGVGSMPWSPLAAGQLTRPWGQTGTTRADNDPSTDTFGRPLSHDSDKAIVDAVQQLAETRGVSMARIALAWVLKNPVVSAPIVGATKPHHLADAVSALDVHLTVEETTALESTTHRASRHGSEPSVSGDLKDEASFRSPSQSTGLGGSPVYYGQLGVLRSRYAEVPVRGGRVQGTLPGELTALIRCLSKGCCRGDRIGALVRTPPELDCRQVGRAARGVGRGGGVAGSAGWVRDTDPAGTTHAFPGKKNGGSAADKGRIGLAVQMKSATARLWGVSVKGK